MNPVGPYKTFNSFVFRVPFFEFKKIINECKDINISSLLDDNTFNESLYLASRSLIREAEKYKKGNLKATAQLDFYISILKYFSRMCTRCTPFGLFAGCGVGQIAEESDIALSPTIDFKSCTRFDMDYLCNLIQMISKTDTVKKQVRYYPNSSIYPSGDHFRYTDYNYKKTKRKYTLASVARTDYLTELLEQATSGCTIDQLANMLVDEEISYGEALGFVEELIDNKVIISEIEPSVTGHDLLIQLIEITGSLNDASIITGKLKNLHTCLDVIDSKPFGKDVSIYEDLKMELGQLSTQYNEDFLFQTDMFIQSNKSVISREIVDLVKKTIRVFNRLTPVGENPVMKKFREDFYKQYEEEEIPLFEALDVETGIGIGGIDGQRGDVNPLLDGIHFSGKPAQSFDLKLNIVQSLLVKKYEDFLTGDSGKEIEITDNDLSILKENWEDLPDTFHAMIEVIRTDESPDGPLISIRSAGGSSAANLLARFYHLDESINNFVKEIVDNEKNLKADKILAEIVHLPESRTGNVLMRPSLRDYEIPYLAKASVYEDHIIPLSDLMISVPQGRYIRLKSKKYNKEVLPRLTCAHNFMNNSLPIYRFLCLLQTQGLRSGIGFNWGPLLESKPYLPRVRYENAFLSPATWNILPADVKEIPKITDPRFFEKVQSFRKDKNIPELALLVQGDNKLLIDFDDLMSVQMLFSETGKRGFKLEEFLYSSEYPLVKRGNEVFTNEVILCFYKDNS